MPGGKYDDGTGNGPEVEPGWLGGDRLGPSAGDESAHKRQNLAGLLVHCDSQIPARFPDQMGACTEYAPDTPAESAKDRLRSP